MFCHSCGKDTPHSVQMGAGRGMQNVCGNCNAVIGVAVPEAYKTQKPQVSTAILPVPADLPVTISAPSIRIVNSDSGLVDSMKARLAFLDAELEKAKALKSERDSLARMLKVAGRKPRKKTKTNVIPMVKTQ